MSIGMVVNHIIKFISQNCPGIPFLLSPDFFFLKSSFKFTQELEGGTEVPQCSYKFRAFCSQHDSEAWLEPFNIGLPSPRNSQWHLMHTDEMASQNPPLSSSCFVKYHCSPCWPMGACAWLSVNPVFSCRAHCLSMKVD